MTDFNGTQPDRDRFEFGKDKPLLFATRPNMRRKRHVPIASVSSKIAQSRLYRAAIRGDIPTRVSVAELHEYLFSDTPDISKKLMGGLVVSALIYEPRLLVNNRQVGKPTQVYAFRNVKDLEYGLEWMICTWLRTFLAKSGARRMDKGDSQAMDYELNKLGTVNETVYLRDYESKYFHEVENDWEEKMAGKAGEWVPPMELRRSEAPRVIPQKPRDLS